MERAQRLFDCLTQVSDGYILEAEAFEPCKAKRLNKAWKQWGYLAAALALTVGVSTAVFGSPKKASDSAAAEAPAASAPAAAETEDLGQNIGQSAVSGTPLAPESGTGQTGQNEVYHYCTAQLDQADLVVVGVPTFCGEDDTAALKVTQVLKGSAQSGQILTVRMPDDLSEDQYTVHPDGGEQIFFLLQKEDSLSVLLAAVPEEDLLDQLEKTIESEQTP